MGYIFVISINIEPNCVFFQAYDEIEMIMAQKKGGKGHIALLVALLLAAICGFYFFASGQNEHDYDGIIEKMAEKHGVPATLIKAVIWKESKFKPNIRGKAGEIGLMQLMPGAIEEWRRGTKTDNTPSEAKVFSPELNIEIGTWYLAWCGGHWADYKSSLILQLSEYNAGYGRVKKWKPADKMAEVKITDITIPGTRRYITDILAKKAEYDKEKK